MELKRILAKDSRRALEEVSATYGEDALVISSGKANGQAEIIVAIDIEADSSEDSSFQPVQEKENSPASKTNSNFKKVLSSEMRASEKASASFPSMSYVEQDGSKEASDREYLRMREIVDLIKLELAAMREEFKLSQKIGLLDYEITTNQEITPLLEFFNQSGMPATLKSLLKGELVEERNLHDAVQKTKRIISDNLNTLKIDWESNKIHVLAGASGSGKTTMAGRISDKIAEIGGPEQVAIISFSDSKLGAWAQSQLIGAEYGISTYRAENTAVLETLLNELASKKTLIIDTPGVEIATHLEQIEKLAKDAQFHLVVPSDASESSINHILEMKETRWSSVMISRFEDHICPWPLISALIKSKVPASYVGHGFRQSEKISIFEKRTVVEHAMSTFSIDFDCETLMTENIQKDKPICLEKNKEKPKIEVKNGQIDPEMMLSDPLLMISKMVEKRNEVTKGI